MEDYSIMAIVHNVAMDSYQHFMNAFVFVTQSLAQKAQEEWEESGRDDDTCTAVLERASKQQQQLNSRDVMSLFKVVRN